MTVIRRFGAGLAEGGSGDAALLGGKGANLCEMARLGLPVPPGFVIGIDAFQDWQAGKGLPQAAIAEAMAWFTARKWAPLIRHRARFRRGRGTAAGRRARGRAGFHARNA